MSRNRFTNGFGISFMIVGRKVPDVTPLVMSKTGMLGYGSHQAKNSQNMIAKLYISTFSSYLTERSISGDVHSGEPHMVIVFVESCRRERPKSPTLQVRSSI